VEAADVEGLTEAPPVELAPVGIDATVVEPGFFRTDFLDNKSLVRTQRMIEEYSATVGAMRSFAEAHNHQRPNDPAKLGLAILASVNAEHPPVRLPLGRDTVAVIEKKKAFVARELAEGRQVAAPADFNQK
jgi:NAD(P)-dependent dehydrogenase (short-subunit alcohol dehydrogenase family)